MTDTAAQAVEAITDEQVEWALTAWWPSTWPHRDQFIDPTKARARMRAALEAAWRIRRETRADAAIAIVERLSVSRRKAWPNWCQLYGYELACHNILEALRAAQTTGGDGR